MYKLPVKEREVTKAKGSNQVNGFIFKFVVFKTCRKHKKKIMIKTFKAGGTYDAKL